jgi:hypothetical protein
MENDSIDNYEEKVAFLDALSETGNISESARIAGVPRRTVYDWRDADFQFAEAWAEAVERGVDALEDEATRRAKDGTEEPVFYQGVECGSVRKFSDTLTIFLLKGRRPDKFKDRVANTLSAPDGGAVQIDNRDSNAQREIERLQQEIASLEAEKIAIPDGNASAI